MRFRISLLLCAFLLVLLVVSAESKSKPSKSGSKGKGHERKTPGHGDTRKHGHRHRSDSSSEEEVSRSKERKDKQAKRKHVREGHVRRNHTFLDAEREFSVLSVVKHNDTLGKYKLRNGTYNEIVSGGKTRNFNMTSHPNSRNSSIFGPAKNISSLQPVFSNSSKLYNTSQPIPPKVSNKNMTKPLYGWSINNSSQQVNKTSFHPVLTNSSSHVLSSFSNVHNKNLSGWAVTNSSHNVNHTTKIVNKNIKKSSYGWNVPEPHAINYSKGFDYGYSKQFVDSSGNMLPISHSYERAPTGNNPFFNPNAKSLTQTFPSMGWSLNQNQGVNAMTNRQSVSQHFGPPPPPLGWIHNPVYNQPQFNHYDNYDPGFANYVKEQDKKKKKKKKFKLDLSLEDFSLEDLSLEDINWKELLKDAGKNNHDKLKKLLQAKKIEKLPTRRLYAAKFPTVNQDLTLQEISSKAITPNITNRSFTGYFSSPTSPKVYARLESSKGEEMMLRMKRDLSPQGQAMANAINKFLQHERDCNETLEAKRRKRDVQGILISKKPNEWKKNTSEEPVISNFGFDKVEAVVQSQLDIEIFAGIPNIQFLDSNNDLNQKYKGNSKIDQAIKDGIVNKEKNKFETGEETRQAKQQSQALTTEKNYYKSKSERRVLRKHVNSTDSFHESVTDASVKDLQDKMSALTLITENKATNNITRLSRVHQTIGEFLGKQPTKLRQVNESLDSWRKSFVENITGQTSSLNRNMSEMVEVTTEHILSRSMRSLLPFSTSDSKESFYDTVSTQSKQDFTYGGSIPQSKNGLPQMSSNVMDSRELSHNNDDATSIYTLDNVVSHNDKYFINPSTSKEDLAYFIPERVNPHHEGSQTKSSSFIQIPNINIRLEEARYATEKYDYAEPILSKEMQTSFNKYPFFGTEANVHYEPNSVSTNLPKEFNGMDITTRGPSETMNIIDAASKSVVREKHKNSFGTNTRDPGTIDDVQTEVYQDSNSTTATTESLLIDVSNDEEYSEENTTVPNEPPAHEPSLGLAQKSIIIHRVRPKTGIPNRKMVYQIYHGLVSSSIKTVARNPGEAIIVAPRKRLVCPKGQRNVRGRCKVIWR